MMMYGSSPDAGEGILPAEEFGLELVEDRGTGCELEESGGDGMVLILNVQVHILTLILSAVLCCAVLCGAIHSFKHNIAVYGHARNIGISSYLELRSFLSLSFSLPSCLIRGCGFSCAAEASAGLCDNRA